jgi:hypothetical protein
MPNLQTDYGVDRDCRPFGQRTLQFPKAILSNRDEEENGIEWARGDWGISGGSMGGATRLLDVPAPADEFERI